MLHKLTHMYSVFLIFTASMLSLGLAVPAGAQTTGGAIVGVVTDSQGGVLPGVTLTARNADTGLTRTAVHRHRCRWPDSEHSSPTGRVGSARAGYDDNVGRAE